jgi:hypothetical protein
MGNETKATALSKSENELKKYQKDYYQKNKQRFQEYYKNKAIKQKQMIDGDSIGARTKEFSKLVEIRIYFNRADFLKNIKPYAVVSRGFHRRLEFLNYLRSLDIHTNIVSQNEVMIINMTRDDFFKTRETTTV